MPPDRATREDPPTTPRAIARGERGTAAVEFALVLPLVLAITLALVQVGLLVRDRLMVESAARAGARAAAVQDDPAMVRAAVTGAASSLDGGAVTVAIARSGTRGDPVTVSVAYASVVRVPLIAWLFGDVVAMSA
ncbi:MAG TPA: TadE/TadG family type IV pilus assembly protein, partial [Actinomycetota bacterium]